MGDAPVDRQALLTVLTTEHFTLQGARASTVSESSARAALFVGAVTSTLVALGFIAQASELGSAFDTFVLVVLPTLYVLGLFTFVRLVTSSTEDLLYGRAINRIRSYYQEVARDEARYLLLGGHDDTLGVLANMGIARPSRWQLYFTLASMVAVLNAVVGGSALAFVAGVAGAALGAAAGVGAVAAVLSCSLHFRWQRQAHRDAPRRGEVCSHHRPPRTGDERLASLVSHATVGDREAARPGPVISSSDLFAWEPLGRQGRAAPLETD